MISEEATQEVNDTLSQLVSHFNQPIHTLADAPPFFASDEAPEVESKVLQFCLNRLKPLPDHAVTEWILGYKTRVHDLLSSKKAKSFPIHVLRTYEIVLRIWRERLKVDEFFVTGAEYELLVDVAAVVSKDIRRVYEEPDQHAKHPRDDCLIPTLLRVLNQILQILLFGEDFPAEENLGSWVDIYLSLLPLGPRISPTVFLPSLCARQTLLELCIFPPTEIPDNSLLSIESADWGDLSLDGMGSLYRIEAILDEVWKNLISLFRLTSHEPSSCRKTVLVRFLDTKRVAQVAQARFFGKGHEESMTRPIEFKVILGRRVERTVKSFDEKPYKTDPSVIHTLMTLVTLLDEKDRESTSALVDYLCPCCLALVDSTNPMHAALGVSALAHLLVVLDSSSAAWRKMEGDILAKLEDMARCHRKGLIVVVMGHSQQIILDRLMVSGKVRAGFCRQWLANLHQAASRSSSGDCWELLVGGIIPGLHRLAMLPDARGLEVVRLGLSVLLPMATGDLVDVRTQYAATVALINLMVSGHPVMHHHGGKILCHLLVASSNRVADESRENIALQQMTRYSAAVCLLLCGSSAQKVIDTVEAEKEKYQGTFLEMLSQVQKMAVNMSAHGR